MDVEKRFSGIAKVGKKSHRGDFKRRGTPIPVSPPRIPTPMPVNGETHKLSQEATKGFEASLNHSKNHDCEEKALPWINPRIIAKINRDNFPMILNETINDFHHSSQLGESQRKNAKEKLKWDSHKIHQDHRKRNKSKIYKSDEKSREEFQERDDMLNKILTSEKELNECTPEKNAGTSFTRATVEGGRMVQVPKSADKFAGKIINNFSSQNNNNHANNSNNNNNNYKSSCAYKFYGFLDSGEENVNQIGRKSDSGSCVAAASIPETRRFKVKNLSEVSSCHSLRHPRDELEPEMIESGKNEKSMGNGKEIVYENLRIESTRGDQRPMRSDLGKSLLKARKNGGIEKRHEHLSKRAFECNSRGEKHENFLKNSFVPDSFSSYNGGLTLRGSLFEDYKSYCDGFSYLESKYTYSMTGIPGNLAQSSAAAAFFARASQKLNLSSPHRRKRYGSSDDETNKSTGFCGAIHKSPPPMPPALLRRIGVKEVTGVGKVKVMLKVTGVSSAMPSGSQSFFNVDSRKKQVTLYDPSLCGAPAGPEDRRVGVAAPKMFAFDAIFTQDDSQVEICSTALTDVIHAVINGTDGCLFCFGHAKLGKTTTMLGTPESANTLGVIPCAISWLFRGIHEQKQKTGARFSVRVSAVEVCQPTQQLKDLLAGHANDCEQSPGVYLRDDPLFGTQLQNQSELRVPNAEKAAFYLDAAVNSRSSKEEGRDSHFLYTLHVYQYSVAGKGGVAGGRSRLHLIDLGSCERGKSSGGIPLSGLGNVLLAIFNGQKHLPYREHKITQLLKECLSSLTCHAAMIAHVSQSSQHYTDTLTTVQLASRIHRMRRRKIKFGGPAGPSVLSNGSSSDEHSRHNASTGSSDFDLSSSEQSADTVIYVAPHDDAATDGEHPPVYMLNLNSVDNRSVLNKAGKGSSPEIRPPTKSKAASPAKSVTSHKTKEEKAVGSPLHKGNKCNTSGAKSSPVRTVINKVTAKPTSENHGKTVSPNAAQVTRHEEQWIDGPRVSKHKVAEARNLLLKESSKKETWIDGPMQKPSKNTGNNQSNGNYGFMDTHKKIMIRKWVENQTVHLKQTLGSTIRTDAKSGLSRSSEPTKDDFKSDHFEEFSERKVEGSSETVKPGKYLEEETKMNVTVSTAIIKQTEACLKELNEQRGVGAVGGESSESSEEEKLPPPPLPLILRYGKDLNLGNNNQPLNALGIQGPIIEDYDDEEDEIELEIVEVTESEEPVPMQDSCLQVTEEDIAFCMGEGENPLPEVDQESHEEHPLRILSQENLTVVSTFTDSMSVTTDFDRCLPRPRYAPPSLFDQPFYPNGPYVYDEYLGFLTKNQNTEANALNRLNQIHEMYKSKMVQPDGKGIKAISSRCQSLSMTDVFESVTAGNHDVLSGNCSIYSEPAYKLPGNAGSICNTCKKNINKDENGDRGKSQKLSEKLTPCAKINISSLRHPDGASNPKLDEDESKERTLGNGDLKSDVEDDNKEKNTAKKKLANTEHKRGNSNSPSRKHNFQKVLHDGQTLLTNDKSNEQIKGNELLKLNESNIKLNSNSPTRNSNSSSRGELRRTNGPSTNKSKRIEESEDAAKSSTPPPTSSSSPLTQKHLYFNKTCPSNEGSDSGHESSVSPKITKMSGRPRPQAQCESSGYESVVSFTSSLESEVEVKLVCDEAEEIHDPGGQPGWWCWCVSSRSSTVQNSVRQSQRHSSSGRSPLTVPPTSARPKN